MVINEYLIGNCWCRLRCSSCLSQMKEALSEIIQLATVDSEPWVLMVADILKSFPETGSLNLDLEEQNPNVQDILGELREKGSGYLTCLFFYIDVTK